MHVKYISNKTLTNLLGPLEDARFTVYEDEREVNIAYVSTCGLQRQSNDDT